VIAVRACVMCLLLAACNDTRGDGDDGGVDPGADAGMTMMSDDAGMVLPPSPLVDPGCVDGMYTEALPDPSADISDLVSGYSASDVSGFVLDVLDRRYPIGRAITAGGDAAGGCIDSFASDTSSADGVLGDLGTIVHECGHYYDNDLSTFDTSHYAITDTLELSCSGGDTVDRGGETFARSRIRGDSFQSERAPCEGGFTGCDFYADVYLDGDPDNAAFEGGDQGFSMLLEEAVQYVNSLATAYAFTGERMTGGSVSDRDGILTLLWYVTRYLHMARLDFPDAYAHILQGDGGCWRNAVLTVWGRAWLFLQATEGMGHLGIDDDALLELVMAPELLDEIQRLRDAEGC
jgi:hypothetical protein